MRGKKRLGVKNLITERILERSYDSRNTGVDLRFLESRKLETDYGSWEEYSVLYEIKKEMECPFYLSQSLEHLSEFLCEIGRLNVESVGIQEIECGLSDYYYVLIYIINNGIEKDKSENNE